MKLYNDFKSIVLNQVPLIDVRSPGEFIKGSLPGAVNLPIMDDADRHAIGLVYKEQGNEVAVALGHELVSGEIKATRVQAWVDYIEAHPDTILFCARGGQRSQIAQQWIAEAMGQVVPRIEGGFKAFRQYLLSALDPGEQHYAPVLLSGFTGAGKTVVIQALANTIDLEGLANHRGSAFGNYLDPQPTQVDFENALAYALIQKQVQGFRHLVFENEGQRIGRNIVPGPLADFIASGPMVLLDKNLEERTEAIWHEYVLEAQRQHFGRFGVESGLKEWENVITGALGRIKKRLGLERYEQLMATFTIAFKNQLDGGGAEGHQDWVRLLLDWYYDPMYDYQHEKGQKPVLFRGSAEEVAIFLRSLA